MTLRYYQNNGIEECADVLAEHKRIVYQLPTGGGKTVIFTEITNRFIMKSNLPVLIVVHREELLKQTRQKLFDIYEINAFEIVAGVKYIPPAKVYICMVESLHRRIKLLPKIGLLLLDECHIAVHNKIIDALEVPYIMGFSASPISSNKKEPLNKRFREIVLGPQISELIENKFLAQNITYAPRTGVDRNNLKTRGDDFDEVEMAKEFSQPKFVINTVEAYKKWGLGTKTLVFNVNIEHSMCVYHEFLEQGYNVKYLDSKCDPEKRAPIIKWFKETPDAILCNVGILTTGFDEPTVETIIVNKATNSLPLWLQMTGRGGRIIDEALSYILNVAQKYSFTIIDMGMNAVTHGDWCDDRDWRELFINPPKKSKGGVSPTKCCPVCEAILHASVLQCKYCNFIYPPKEIGVEELMDDYVVLTKNIDVEKLVSENEKNKQYFTFFKMCRLHVSAFRRTKKKLDNEIFEFILNTCMLDVKRWCKLNDKKFNAWHKQLCLTELQKELKYEYRILQENN